jgi:AraC-like DNA-binding protein
MPGFRRPAASRASTAAPAIVTVGRPVPAASDPARRAAGTPIARAAGGFGDLGVGPLRTVPPALCAADIEPAPLLRRHGLSESLLEDDLNRVPFPLAGALLASCVVATGQPHFGLLAGRHFELPMLGPLGYLMRYAPNARAALRALMLQLHLHDRGAAVTFGAVDRRRHALTYAVFTPDTPSLGVIYELAMMIGYRIMKSLCGPLWQPLEVRLSREAPVDAAPYRTLFEAPVRFNAALSMLVFESRWLDAGNPASDPGLYRTLGMLLAAIEAQSPRPLTERLRAALGTGVLAGTANAAFLADLFSLSQRSLRRHLAREGVTLKTLVNEARVLVAQQLLSQTRMPLAEIAAALHYSDATAFSRAFRSAAGVSPTHWRARQTVPAAADRR